MKETALETNLNQKFEVSSVRQNRKIFFFGQELKEFQFGL